MISSSVTVDRLELDRLADLEVLPVAHEGRSYRYVQAMRTRRLGPLEVTVVGLGCNNFGGRVDDAATRAVVDAALDSGVTFFDTADIYGNGGASEEAARRASSQGRRDRVVLATKCGKPMGDGAERRGSPRLHPLGARGVAAAAADRRRRPLPAPRGRSRHAARGDGRHARRAGRGRARSAPSARRTTAPETLAQARSLGSVAFVSEQSEYSWLERGAEAELLPACERLGLGFIPYFPLASGLLTGKVSREHPPAEGTRLHGSRNFARRSSTRSRRLDRVGRGARACRCSTWRSAGWPPCRRSRR